MTPLAIASRYGTPLYVYELDHVRTAFARLKAALPASARIYYSLKANPNPSVAKFLAQLGCKAEVSSVGELSIALGSGFACEDILFSGPAKSEADLRKALAAGCVHYSVDSAFELAKLRNAACQTGRRADAILRINPDIGAPGMGLTMCGTASQFGVDTRQILEARENFESTDLVEVAGYHFYMGSNLASASAVLLATRVALETAAVLRGDGPSPKVLDLGGGFGHPYGAAGEAPDLADLRSGLEEMLDEWFCGWRTGTPMVAFESGRFLVGGCGVLLTSVVDVKQSKGERFVLLDSGINHLGGMSALQRIRRSSIRPEWPQAADNDGKAHLVGPLCTPVDTLARSIPLPRVQPGAILIIPNVGAYGLTASLIGFLSHENPLEVVLDRGILQQVSRLKISRCVDMEEAPADGSGSEIF